MFFCFLAQLTSGGVHIITGCENYLGNFTFLIICIKINHFRPFKRIYIKNKKNSQGYIKKFLKKILNNLSVRIDKII